MAESNSVGQQTHPVDWLRENVAFFRMRIKSTSLPMDGVLSDIDELGRVCVSNLGRALENCSLLEIGYGARPNRLMALQSMGVDAVGIDLDQPMLETSFRTLFSVAKRNGYPRAIKTAVRHLFFDRGERRRLATVLAARGYKFKFDPNRFLVGNAATQSVGRSSFDVVFSQDVFEHIPVEDLESVCERVAALIGLEGLFVVAPHIYTGIAGSHLPEWYPGEISSGTKQTEPWEHLRKKRRRADCYLNELRLDDYRRIFVRRFEILSETDLDDSLGEELLTKEIEDELNSYSRDELLSNRVRFVMRAKR